MKVFLKANWSEQFIYGDKTPGYFVGRDQEIKNLKSIILNNDSSAILISSIRGVGKSSFVHKVLTEAFNKNKKIIPIFVNVGHALLNADISEDDKATNYKKMLLNSIIRATYFNSTIKQKDRLKKIYEKSIGSYKIEKSTQDKVETEYSLGTEIKLNKDNIIALLGVFLTSFSFVFNNWLKYLFGILGPVIIFLSFAWKKSWTESIFNKNENIIDNSIEYLEIEFEKWLKLEKEKNKLIFVIDELDKIDVEKAFKVIKEFKNLFTRSFAHFIFIASQEAFDSVNGNREDKDLNKGILPTLFTHVYYLPFPTSQDLKNYLQEIFKVDSKVESDSVENFKNYLLFKSKNDFFLLKRLISDLISFDNKENPYLDIEQIKEYDKRFLEISKLFAYVDSSIERHLKKLKKYWFDNSNLQKNIFNFLNYYYGNNFNVKKEEKTESISLLLTLLLRAEIIKKNPEIKDESIEGFIWTGKFNLDKADDLFEEEKEMIKQYKELIRIANDLDEFPKRYKDKKFELYEEIYDERDGRDLSSINLYSIFNQYKDIRKKLDTNDDRLKVNLEDVKEALQNIKQTIENVYSHYFEIFFNLIIKIFPDNPNIFPPQRLDSPNYNIQNVFNSLPNFRLIVEKFDHRIIGRTDNTKYLVIIKDFKEEVKIQESLQNLPNQMHILVLNLIRGKIKNRVSPKISYQYNDKRRRNREKKIKLNNFINYTFSDFRDFSDMLVLIEKHLIG